MGLPYPPLVITRQCPPMLQPLVILSFGFLVALVAATVAALDAEPEADDYGSRKVRAITLAVLLAYSVAYLCTITILIRRQ